jgi:uncharacterized protein YbaP (TraB family)
MLNEKEFNMLNHTIKAIDNINNALLTLKIQAVQVKNDAAARGMMAAADAIRKTTEKLEDELITYKNSKISEA